MKKTILACALMAGLAAAPAMAGDISVTGKLEKDKNGNGDAYYSLKIDPNTPNPYDGMDDYFIGVIKDIKKANPKAEKCLGEAWKKKIPVTVKGDFQEVEGGFFDEKTIECSHK